MNDIHDIAVLGGGPAGMAAALQATELGARVVVLDEQPHPGGQIYRNVDQASQRQIDILGPDYKDGRALTQALQQSRASFLGGSTIWDVSRDGVVTFTRNGTVDQVRARHLILATGALERPMPLPGWTLPGVMTAGAGQILLKSGGMVARDAVLIGSGPLLYLLAAQMIAAGRKPIALLETQDRADLWAARADLPGALRGWRYLLKGAKLLSRIKAARIPRYIGVTDIAMEGDQRLKTIRFSTRGTSHVITADIALLHHGVVPNTQITRALRLDHVYDARQKCFVPKTDRMFTSSDPAISVIGDGAGIGGATAAAISGRIAAFGAVDRLGLSRPHSQTERLDRLLGQHAAELAVRPFLDRLYPPHAQSLSPDDQTIVCRCEEVTAGAIRRLASAHCKGPNQLKAFSRAGMGPCQGRFCGPTITEILSAETGQSPMETGGMRIRSPIKPVTLAELAAAPESSWDAQGQESPPEN